MTLYAFIEWYLPTVFMLAASILYFWTNKGEKNLWIRIGVSAHGIAASVLYLGAMLIWNVTRAYHPWAALPFLLAYLIPLASIIYGCFRYSGPKMVHLSQVLNVVCIFYTYCVGGMAITGDWL